MRRSKWFLFCGFLCFLYLQGKGMAENVYVTDRLYLSLRNTPDLQQPSVALVQSDTRVDILETDGEWAKIRLEDGTMGWVMNKYLVTDTPKSLIIKELKGQINNNSLTIEDLRGQIKDMSRIIKELEEEIKTKSHIIEDLQSQMRGKSLLMEDLEGETEDMPLVLERLREENASLKKEVSDLAALRVREAAMEREIEDLKTRIDDQKKSPKTDREKTTLIKRKEIYIIGILALVVGLVVGYLVRRPDKNRFYLR